MSRLADSLVPGTLNVRLPEPFERSLASLYIAASEISPEWEAETGQAGYFFLPVLVAGRYRCMAFRPTSPDTPPTRSS